MPTPRPARRGAAPADRRPDEPRGEGDRRSQSPRGDGDRRTHPARGGNDRRADSPRAGGDGRPAPPRGGSVEHLYGRNAVREALRGPRRVRRLLLSEGARLDERLAEIAALAEGRSVEVRRVDRVALDELVPGANHQGVVAEAGRYVYADAADIASRPGVVVALDHLHDPQNVGTLLRAAVAFSAAGVLIPADRAADITPAVVNTSAGATEHLAVAQVVNLARELDRMKTAGRWVVGLDVGPDAVPIGSSVLPSPTVLVVGAEGPGIGRLVRERCDLIVSIPISPTIDSLNAATAASIALYELARQSHPPTPPA